MLASDYYTLIITLSCTALLGFTAGIIGAFAVLRQQSLLGDAVAHACLPGTVLAFIATGSTAPHLLMLGSCCAGLLAIICIKALRATTTLKMDGILGTILSVFFGFGLVCMTIAQKYGLPHQSTLTTIIFGNAATLFAHDVALAACSATLVLSCVLIFWKELTLYTFDTDYSDTLGYQSYVLDTALTFLLISTIALGLHMVGVVLMSTMLVAPAATARLWTTRMNTFVIFSGWCGALFSMSGTLLSSQCMHMPTGPVIAVVAIVCVLISLVLSSSRLCMRKKRSL